jgi:RNA polymerase sigma factor (sigma-70 family)
MHNEDASQSSCVAAGGAGRWNRTAPAASAGGQTAAPAGEQTDRRSAFVERIARQVAGERGAFGHLEELQQEGELKLLEMLQQRPGVDFPFCRKRLEGHMLDWLRKERKQGTRSNVIPIDSPDHALLPDEQLRRQDRRQGLKAGVVELPKRERDVINRLYRDGATQADVAGELGVSQSRVSRIHQLALRRILPFVVHAQAA